jgi:GT2 family glycosyltransferase
MRTPPTLSVAIPTRRTPRELAVCLASPTNRSTPPDDALVAASAVTVREAAGVAPELSVIIPAVNNSAHLATCLEALRCQRGAVRVEVIVVECGGTSARELAAARYPEVRVLSSLERLTIPALRAIGIAHSLGPIVAVTEDHCIPTPDWCERIVEAHHAPHAAIGGAVENASTRRLVDWAVFLCEYYRHVHPVEAAENVPLPGMNVAYKREALDRLPEVLAAERWENVLHDRLLELGYSLYLDPKMLVLHRKSFTFGEFLVQRFHYARAYAGVRVEDSPLVRRAFFVVGSLGLAPLILGRIARQLFRRRRHRLIFLLTLPLVGAFTLSWTAGEFLGYLAGPGDSLLKVE